MKYQVFVTASGGGQTYPFGPKVSSLVECSVLASTLEWLFDLSCEMEYDPLHPPFVKAVEYYEGCDVTAQDEEGNLYYLDSEDKWELMNESNS